MPFGAFVLVVSIFGGLSVSAQNYSFEPNVPFWETPWIPGQLLQSLDRMTADTQLLHTPLPLSAPTSTPPPLATIQRRAELPSEPDTNAAAEAEEEGEEQEDGGDDGAGEYHYDRAYEQFVRQYFDRSAKDADADVAASLEDADDEEEEVLEEQVPEASTPQKCKKVRRNHQDCEICQNARNGEKSETCSYSTESEPQSYAYSKERNYRKMRNSPDTSDESSAAADDDERVEKTNASNSGEIAARTKKRHHRRQPVRGGEKRRSATMAKNSGSSSCTKKTQRDRVCYYCERNDGRKMVKCYARNEAKKSPPNDAGGPKKAHKVEKTQQRIYKRTVTHSTWREGH